jgi:hypothetical protein
VGGLCEERPARGCERESGSGWEGCARRGWLGWLGVAGQEVGTVRKRDTRDSEKERERVETVRKRREMS